MTTQGEFAIAQSWIVATLSADSTITGYVTNGIWDDTAPENTPAPYIVMINTTDMDAMVVNQDRIFTTMTYNVQLVVPGNDIISGDAAFVRIGQLLHQGSGTTAGGKVLACTRIRVGPKGNSLAAGVEFRHLGQTFELLVQQN